MVKRRVCAADHRRTARGYRAVLTDAQKLGDVWAETARRLQAFLRSRGVGAADAEEIVQEVAVRALRSGVTFIDADDLVRWGCTVAWRVRVDRLRSAQVRPTETAMLVDVPAGGNVEATVAARLHLQEVARAISTLTSRDQQVLLATVDDTAAPCDAREAGRIAVARHRARARLLKSLGSVGAAIGLVLRRSRWIPVGVAAAAVLILAIGQLPRGSTVRPAPVGEPTTARTATITADAPPLPAAVQDGVASAPRVTPSIHAAAGPSATVLVHMGTARTPVEITVTKRARRPTDHLLCTGSLILLPHVCIG